MTPSIINLSLLVLRSNLIFKKSLYFLLSIILAIHWNQSITQAADAISLNASNMAQPVVIDGTSGGAIKAQEIAQTTKTATGFCDGYVSYQPNHLLKLESFFAYLRLEINSQADTTIIIKGPGGVWCNDDAGTANPMIEGQWQVGLYQVWIGSYYENTDHNYQIKITGK
ncbi:MAG: hypothetical protein AAF298_25115 [Cyanobacteria bacterium P01_A01_bin.40]